MLIFNASSLRFSLLLAVVCITVWPQGVNFARADEKRFPSLFAAPSSAPMKADEQALRAAAQHMREGQYDDARQSLQSATEQGNLAAQWKMAHLTERGQAGFAQNSLKAFEIYERIADRFADKNPYDPDARFVAAAFVALGGYYVRGIEGSAVKPDMQKARRFYEHAATYFRDAEAQYHLGCLFLEPKDASEPEPKKGAMWLRIAADKGHAPAQAVLGDYLFHKNERPRARAAGLAWLHNAEMLAAPEDLSWISDKRAKALALSSERERDIATEIQHRRTLGGRYGVSEDPLGGR